MHKYIIKFYDSYLILSHENNNKLSFKNETGNFLRHSAVAAFYEYFICARCSCSCSGNSNLQYNNNNNNIRTR